MCPIPGVNVAIDVGLVAAFALRCQHVFGMTEDSLKAVLTAPQIAVYISKIAATVSASTSAIISYFLLLFCLFHFVSFRFVSFRFISFHFITLHFISFRFTSFHFVSLFLLL
jgi:hypothetical protein